MTQADYIESLKAMDLEELELEEQYLIDRQGTELRKWGRYCPELSEQLDAVRELMEEQYEN